MQQKKKLSLFDLVMIVVSFVIGMGIFRTPVNVAAKAQIPELFFTAWIIGGFVAFCGALTYAEIGSRFPVTGGYYKIFSACYHPSIAFAINCIVIVSNAASLAGVALIGSEYLSKIILPEQNQTAYYRLIIASISIGIFYGINLLGLKTSAKVQNVLSMLKIIMVLTLICAVFTHETTPLTTTIFINTSHAPNWVAFGKALGLCLIAVSFTYGGYQQTINFGEETKNANKTVPRAIAIGLSIIVILYLSINYAYVKVIGFEQLKTAESIAAILAGKLFGPIGFTLLSGLIFLSVLGYVNVNLMSNPRVLYAMGEERALPAVFAKQSKNGVLTISLTVFAVLAIFTLFYAKTFDKILNYTIFLDSFGMATSAATIFILRKRTAHLDKTKIYSMNTYPLMPIIFISAYLFVAFSIYLDDTNAALNGLYIFTGFMIIYFISRFFNRKNLA